MDKNLQSFKTKHTESWRPRTAISNGCMRVWLWRTLPARVCCRKSCDADDLAERGLGIRTLMALAGHSYGDYTTLH